MKKLIILLAFFLQFMLTYGQDLSSAIVSMDQARYNEILTLLKRENYLQAVKSLNEFMASYPAFGYGFYVRGWARLKLNDVLGARRDFKLALGAGADENREFITSMTSKKDLVSMLMKDLKDDTPLDMNRDFRPIIQPKDTLQGSLRPERTCFDVYFYNLTVKILPETKSIEGTNEIFFRTLADAKTIQIDLYPQLSISNIRWNGKNLSYKRIEGAVFIDFGESIPAGTDQKIDIDYSGSPIIAKKPPWNGGLVWDKDKRDLYIGVSCEQIGASVWWPCKDHLSDKPDSMTINIQVPAGYKGISNGNLRSEHELGNGYVNFEWFVSYPINSYNVTFYVGKFVNFNEIIRDKGGEYQADYYVLPKNLEKAKKFYYQEKDILTTYAELFGEFPFRRDGEGMVEAPFEGMEHQGAIAIGDAYGQSSAKRNYWTRDYDYLLIHETGHEWWGNALAISDMADAWINEGFTTYGEALFAENRFDYVKYISAMAYDFDRILNIWPVVGERNINSNTFIGGDIYMKGAAMLHNLRCIINNDSLFMNMIRDFNLKYRFKVITTNDFTEFVKTYCGNDYKDFFKSFLYTTEPPILVCDYTIGKGNHLTFTYRWVNVGKDFSMPFCIATDEKSGYIRLVGTTEMQTFTADDVKDFFLPNENHYNPKLVPQNSFTYYWTSWPF